MFQETRFRKRLGLIFAVLCLATGGIATAQLQTGNLYGTVSDNEGEVLPGVTVTISGVGAAQVQITNAEGQFRFIGLAPGSYKLEAKLEGFTSIEYPNVRIQIGRNTTIRVQMATALEELITVTSETPLLDERKLGTGTTVSDVELEKIPTSRDPWSLLNQAPGVQVDRINVGGNESGQQSIFVGTGASSGENSFAVDGVVITDMAAVGASPTYYDFDAFQQVQLSTGGSDVALATGGVTVNLVTKRGTNQWRGSGRFFLTDESYQSNSGFSRSDLAPGQSDLTPNEIDRIDDVGGEVGGFLIKDRLWIWGAYGEQDIVNLVPGVVGLIPDATTLENYNGKLNAQLSSSNSGIFQFSRGDKIKDGRGAGPQRPLETTWDQSGPTEIWKLEDTHIFSSNFYLTGLWSFVDGGFALAPKGGTDDQVLRDADNIWRRTYADFGSDRDVDQWRLDGSYFFNTGKTGHELRFGTSRRDAETTTGLKWGSGAIVFEREGPGALNRAWVLRGEKPSSAFSSDYEGFWVHDTITAGHWTVSAGFRYDVQDGQNEAFSLQGSSLLPDLLPTLDFAGNDADGFDFTEISPRVGVTYALGEERRTLLRGSYARFAQQLQQGLLNRVNPLDEARAEFDFIDVNGNLRFEPGEPMVGAINPVNFDPANPTALVSPNRNDPDLSPELTDEINLGIEHAFLPEFVAGFNLTWRSVFDLHELHRLVRDEGSSAVREATIADYVPFELLRGSLPDGSEYAAQTYSLRPEVRVTGGRLLTNGDREQDYLGASFHFTKRLANQWMLRGHFTYYDWEWDIPASFFLFDDPNDLAPGDRPITGTDDDEAFDNDGAVVAEQSGGSGDKGDIFLNSRWSFNLNGMYQVAPARPWAFNVSANVTGREGYPLPYYINDYVPSTSLGGDGITRDIQVSGTDAFRGDDLFSFDLRVDKDFELGQVGLNVSIDAFNIFNAGTVLQRERNLGGGQPNFVDETLSPRVFRFGVRLNWK